MSSRHLPDWNIEPPEDNREVISNCAECDYDILEGEDGLHSEYLNEDFCSLDCLHEHIGLTSKTFETY